MIQRDEWEATAEMNVPSLKKQMQSSTVKEPLGDQSRSQSPLEKESCSKESEELKEEPCKLRVGNQYSL